MDKYKLTKCDMNYIAYETEMIKLMNHKTIV